MLYYLNATYFQKFNIGNWMAVAKDGGLKKVKSQDVINIKLGVKNVLDHSYLPYIHKIIKINGNRIYYSTKEIIKIRN